MLSILFFAMMTNAIFLTEAIKRYNSTILSQQIIYYLNDYFSIEIIDEGNDSVIFMNIDRPINEEDEIQFSLRMTKIGEPAVTPFKNEMNLCSLIWTEVHNLDSIEAMYKASQAFHLNGLECPIGKRSLKLIPWMMPNQHFFEPGIKCGIWNYELTLRQCLPPGGCAPLIIANLEVMMKSEDCYIQDNIFL